MRSSSDHGVYYKQQRLAARRIQFSRKQFTLCLAISSCIARRALALDGQANMIICNNYNLIIKIAK